MFHSFDTHQIVKSFITSGFNEKQAEVIVKAIAESRDNDLSHLATKVDLADTKAELKSDIADTKAELKGDIANIRTDLADIKAELKGDIANVRAELADTKANLKGDIADTKAELKGDIANVRTEIEKVRGEIKEVKNDLLKWFIGISATLGIAVISTMITCFKLFIH